MRLDKLRGYGPLFAFATPVLFFLSVIAAVMVVSSIHLNGRDQPPTLPGWFDFGVAVWLILLGGFMVSGLIVALDLEWIEHPLTHTGLTYVALGAMAVATVAFLITLLQSAFAQGSGTWVTGVLTFAGLGLYLVLMNLVGLRAHLWGRVLPWIGIVSGGFWILAGLSIIVPFAGFLGVALLPAVPLYFAWSIWLGFRLRGSVASAAAPSTGAAQTPKISFVPSLRSMSSTRRAGAPSPRIMRNPQSRTSSEISGRASTAGLTSIRADRARLDTSVLGGAWSSRAGIPVRSVQVQCSRGLPRRLQWYASVPRGSSSTPASAPADSLKRATSTPPEAISR